MWITGQLHGNTSSSEYAAETVHSSIFSRSTDGSPFTRLGLSGYQQETCVLMQACAPGFSLAQRLSASRQGSSRLPSGITVVERPVRWLSSIRGGRIGRSSGEYRIMSPAPRPIRAPKRLRRLQANNSDLLLVLD